jgi:hypothetical protein
MKNPTTPMRVASLLSLILLACTMAYGQLIPSGDAYTNAGDPTTNYGAKTLLDVEGASQTTYIQFNLSSIPSGYTGADITQATLKLYVNAVTKAGSFNVDFVNGNWSESTIDASNAPALGSTIAASVPLTTADKNQYILINVTAAVQAWLNGTANDGIALVGNSPLNATFDSKESTTTSHAAELDIVFAPGHGGGITGITTASGSGLMGGGTSGTLDLSLTNTCAKNQELQWSGTAWACASAGTGTITGVTAGTDLTGGGASGNVTLSLNTAATNALYAQLSASNTFTGNQTVNGGIVANTNDLGVLGESNATSGNTAGVAGFASSPAGYGVYGSNSSSGAGVYGAGGTGVYGVGPAYGVYATTANSTGYGVYGVEGATTGNTAGVYGSAASKSGYGVEGQSPNIGVYGQSTDNYIGVLGTSPNIGVYGAASGSSKGGEGYANIGVWGDTEGTSGEYIAVLATADNNIAGVFQNDTPNENGQPTLVVANLASSPSTAQVLEAVGGAGNSCIIDIDGDLTCTGKLSGSVNLDGGARKVALYSMQSPDIWFEDAGSGQLSNGSARIAFDPTFAQTVNAGIEYHVFLTPGGDCKGLYVSQKSTTSFEVHELGGGNSSVAFDYRIMAKRVGYENVRLEDLTEQFKKQEAQRQKLRHPARPPAAPLVRAVTSMPQLKAAAQPVTAQPR